MLKMMVVMMVFVDFHGNCILSVGPHDLPRVCIPPIMLRWKWAPTRWFFIGCESVGLVVSGFLSFIS